MPFEEDEPDPVFGNAFTAGPLPVVLGFVGTTTAPPPEPWVGAIVTVVIGVAPPGCVGTVVAVTAAN